MNTACWKTKNRGKLIAKSGRPVARVVPLAHGAAVRRKGLLKGKIIISDDVDQPLPDDVIDLFEGRSEP